ncbi:putative polysaccharide biosynthesis protein [Lentibacillus sp. Marseille-P4043]|uniref:putative polysaccharide biosynthesis protein n=1 Tax=Lentibacillus sp. Marseille-P4043 TaxID=2040293 RepID=UPI000D0AF3CA|nr:polysaccharide biosynthesis protein [Lentibacillus sp. Marseille-P4043]
MASNESNKLVRGALLLTLAGFVSKLLSAGYRIPLQNLTGDLGFYIYQQIYPFLGMVLVLSLYGFPSAISKIAVDLKSEGRQLSFTRFFVPVFTILLTINGAIFLFLLSTAGEIANWMGNPKLQQALQFAAFAFLLIPFSSLLRGAFQGSYQMKPTALSQIGEQFIRVFIIILAAVLIVINGRDIYEIGQAAAIASIAGGIMAIIVLGMFLFKQRLIQPDLFTIPWGYYLKTLLIFGIIAALNHMVLIVIQFADAFTLVPGLKDFGISQIEAMELKGVFDRGQPLIQLGTVIGSSFALALIPSISKQKLQSNPQQSYHYIRSGLIFSFYLAVGATVGLLVIFPEVNTVLFENDLGTTSLRILSIAVFLCSLAITASSILQGLGYIKRTAAFILIAFFIKWTLNQLFVPLWSITGSAIATVISLLVLCGLVIIELRKKLPDLNFWQTINWHALLIASCVMVVYLYLIHYVFVFFDINSRLGLLAYVIGVAVTGAVVYMVLLVKKRAFSEEELMMLPFSSFFIWLHRGRNSLESKN